MARHWTDLERRSFYGSLFWLAFSALAVAIRGVRWEETYEQALMITGMAPYPEGHPSVLYARNLFTVQGWLSAAMLAMSDSALLVNGFRNWLQLAFTTLPVFLLGTWLTGLTRWGHLAVVFVLVGIHQSFQSYYPIYPWPNLNGMGQIGMGWALLCLALLVGQYYRAAFLLLGLMAAIHLGQLPVLLLVAGLVWLALGREGKSAEQQSATWAFAMGIGISAVLWIVQMLLLKASLPTVPPYAADGDSYAIWLGYSTHYDVHRFIPRLNPFVHSVVVMVAALLFLGEGYLYERRNSAQSRPLSLLFVYSVAVCGVVGLTMALHSLLGERVPFLLIGWMPYRLTNHLAPILLVAVLALFARAEQESPRWRGAWVVLVLAILLGTLVPYLKDRMRTDGYEMFIENTVPIFFLMAGAAAMIAAGRSSGGRWGIGLAVILALSTWGAMDSELGTSPAFALAVQGTLCVLLPLLLGLVFRKGLLGSLLIGLTFGVPFAALATFHQFGTIFTAIGAALAGLSYAICWVRAPRRAMPALVFGLLAALPLGALLEREYRDRQHLPVSEFQSQVVSYLKEQGDEKALLVTPYWESEWLARTGHPVMSDARTAQHMTYLPSLAPSIKKMHEEIYADPIEERDDDGQLDGWRERSVEEWQALGEHYGFRHVIAPIWVAPALPLVVEVELEGMYEIPSASP